MKRVLVWVLLALGVGGVLGAFVARDAGYVLLAYGDRTMETSLWVFVVLLVAAYVLLRALIVGVRWVAGTRGSLHEWNRGRRARLARDGTARGLVLMAEGRWDAARKELLRAPASADAPLVNYLAAARAAHAAGDSSGVETLLERARDVAGDHPLAVTLTAAELELEAGDVAHAIARLEEAHRDHPRDASVLRLLARCFEKAGDGAALRALVPELAAAKALPPDALERVTRLAWTMPAPSPAAGTVETQTQLDAGWKSLRNDLRSEPDVVAAHARRLVALGRNGQAESLLRAALEQRWDEDLVELYGGLRADDPEKQLHTAEGWLRQRPHSAALLRALGRVALANGQPAKAREYLEGALRLDRSEKTYRDLGRICLGMGDTTRAAEYLARAEGFFEGPAPEPPNGPAAARN